jgi:hypothetical protein
MLVLNNFKSKLALLQVLDRTGGHGIRFSLAASDIGNCKNYYNILPGTAHVPASPCRYRYNR